ncbi:MAG TPA: ISAs1 family transposase [Thermomicrobiales bacterium]
MTELERLGGGLTAVTIVEPKVRHGRRETRMLWALTDPALNARAGEAGTHQAPWPHLAQVCRVRRRRVDVRTGEIEDKVTYAITSLLPDQADAGRLLALLRDHWHIENGLHHVRDVTFDEDRCPIRTKAAPQVCAALRNLVLALLRRAEATNLAAACRTFAGRPRTAVALVATAGCPVVK